jgi:nucleotide-binding universal stress UspA family protein
MGSRYHGGPSGPAGRRPSAEGGAASIVVGVDGSDRARLAVKWAADEARVRGTALRIVYAGANEPRHVPAWFTDQGPDQTSAVAGGLPASEAVLDDAVALVATRHPSLMVHGDDLAGPAALELIDASRMAELLVVGARGKGPLKGMLLGSISEECIRYAWCPVVVVRSMTEDPAPRAAGGRIVVGIDGSAGSDRALRWALSEARIRDASVEAVFGWQYPPIGAMVVGPWEGYETAAHEIVESASSLADQWEPVVPFQATARFDTAASALLQASSGADLLVVGARGASSFHDLLLGSVAHQCARSSKGALVVVRPSLPAVDSDTPDRVGSNNGRPR